MRGGDGVATFELAMPSVQAEARMLRRSATLRREQRKGCRTRRMKLASGGTSRTTIAPGHIRVSARSAAPRSIRGSRTTRDSALRAADSWAAGIRRGKVARRWVRDTCSSVSGMMTSQLRCVTCADTCPSIERSSLGLLDALSGDQSTSTTSTATSLTIDSRTCRSFAGRTAPASRCGVSTAARRTSSRTG